VSNEVTRISVEHIIEELNPSLKGWFGYFKHARSSTFRGVDGFVRRRLRAVLRKQIKHPGQGTAWSDKLRWSNAFFAKLGLFTTHKAWIIASQSRCIDPNKFSEVNSEHNLEPSRTSSKFKCVRYLVS